MAILEVNELRFRYDDNELFNDVSFKLNPKEHIVLVGENGTGKTTFLKLISKKGFDNLNVEDITKACKIAKGTFYIYFKHKEDIVFEICRPPFEQIKIDFQIKNSFLKMKIKN